jgi:hypothetical protein
MSGGNASLDVSCGSEAVGGRMDVRDLVINPKAKI